ncbi:MAG TPA: P-loop NTPase, partial [Bacteroidota bacterium]|nr:P-loop NTPase [Bacteroidota bacterium]
TTPQDISLADARKAFKMFEKVNVPVLGIIENMSYFICGHCGTREDIFATGGGRKEAVALNTPFLGEIPIYTPIRIGSDTGKPIVVSEPKSQQAQIIRSITRAMAAQMSISQFTSAAPEIEISLK